MEITLKNVGRRFNKEWIFRNINYTFKNGSSYAILGPNGSGKSTLLNVLLGGLAPSEGEITYHNPTLVNIEEVYQYISLAAPYLDLIEEFTLEETIDFHFQFKRRVHDLSTPEIIKLLGLEKAKQKAIKHFSSGMKQRTKLTLACCADTPILFLDEPTSNLDSEGIDWYLKLIEDFTQDKLLVIGSNQAHEYDFCQHQLHINRFKG
jgi:ABC-type multidrug transport system ATPase subunit